jgi:hypothetical protein
MIDRDYVMRMLEYNAETGVFTWKSPPRHHPRMLGKEAGCASTGYTLIRIRGAKIKAHRLAWLVAYGEIPSKDIDHINGDPLDNRISNLRLASNPQNQANRRRNAGKDTPKGVRRTQSGKYQARIRVAGKAINIGVFDTESLASNAYFVEAKKYYGEFARSE